MYINKVIIVIVVDKGLQVSKKIAIYSKQTQGVWEKYKCVYLP